MAALAAAAGEKSGACGVLKDLADTLVGPGRALEVLVGANLLADLLTLLFDGQLMVASPCVMSERTSSGETGFWLVLPSS